MMIVVGTGMVMGCNGWCVMVMVVMVIATVMMLECGSNGDVDIKLANSPCACALLPPGVMGW